MNNNLIIPKYPEDFHDYSDDVKIPEEEINLWINRCINILENDKSKPSHLISCGNTLVEVHRIEISENNFEYAIVVFKNFQEAIAKENYNDNICSIN